MNAIEVKNLYKTYKTKTAVNGISFTVKQGELFSLLGVNGAGKTTTIRMLTCLSSVTAGDALVNGLSVKTDFSSIKKHIGISPQDTAVAENLTVKENLVFMAQVQGLKKKSFKKAFQLS